MTGETINCTRVAQHALSDSLLDGVEYIYHPDCPTMFIVNNQNDKDRLVHTVTGVVAAYNILRNTNISVSVYDIGDTSYICVFQCND